MAGKNNNNLYIVESGDQDYRTRTLRDLVKTPLKKTMFVIQILSYLLILGSPVIGAVLGKTFNLSTGQTAGMILGVFIAGEILFYASLAFIGKEMILFLRDRILRFFRSRKANTV